MPQIHDEQYSEIIKLFLEFRKIEGGDLALAFLQAQIRPKIREYTRGAMEFSELKDGERFIVLPLNGFDCCRLDGMSYSENGSILLEKFTNEKGKPGARRVSNGSDYSIHHLIDLVIRIV